MASVSALYSLCDQNVPLRSKRLRLSERRQRPQDAVGKGIAPAEIL